MRDYLSPTEIAHLQARSGVRPRILVWITARNLTSGEPETAGFWSGEDNQEFVIDGVTRPYVGAGGLLGMDDIPAETGIKVRTVDVWLATAAPEVVEAARAYDLRLAPVEIHRVLTDPVSHKVIAAPHRIWKGSVDAAPLVTPAVDGDGGRLTMTVVSAARALTRGLTGKWSDESMRLRGDDRLFRHADISGKVPVYWGEKKYGTETAKTSGFPGKGGLK